MRTPYLTSRVIKELIKVFTVFHFFENVYIFIITFELKTNVVKKLMWRAVGKFRKTQE